MRRHYWKWAAALSMLLTFAAISGGGAAFANQDEDHDRLLTFRVSLQNLTRGQPFSPPAAATHDEDVHMFQVGALATDELAAIAQDGNESPMVSLFNALRFDGDATDVVDVGQPITPRGVAKGGFSDSVTFTIRAHAGDRFSIAAMLICTNDGFTGLDGVKLPRHGNRVFLTNAYDAGREVKTEKQPDLVEPCSLLGPVVLPGVHPSPNFDPPIDPPYPIRMHAGIQGAGDLSVALHGWVNPVAKITITRVS
jgi:hypothetical protein